MMGHVDAGKGEPRQLPTNSAVASRLAFYADSNGLGILAPRNWHCFEIYGSDGAFLVVSPTPISNDSILAARRPQGFTHPVIVLNSINGFTSGRDEVSPVVNRVFPRHRAFVINSARNMDQPIPRQKPPFPGDQLHYLSPDVVEYTTRPHHEGLGTQGFLRPTNLEITGVDILVKEGKDCCDLVSLAIRLAPADAALAGTIRQQLERETAPQ
jgi:hypothetical protein